MWGGGGVNLVSSTPSGAESKEVVSADFLPDYVADKADSRIENKFNQCVTNCITEIPQDIKLDLRDGVLTLKAGSKLYVPNGFEADGTTRKFDTFICPSDLILQGAETGLAAAQRVIVIDTETYKWTYRYLLSSIYSADDAPAVSEQYGLWYDTASNVIKRTADTGATWTTAQTSLPLCIYTRAEGGLVSSIDATFNGFGVIGNVVYALPGVKYLGTFGRDSSGRYQNKAFQLSSVLFYQFTNGTSGTYWVGFDATDTGNISYFGLYVNRSITSIERPNVTNCVWFNPETGFGRYINSNDVLVSEKYAPIRVALASFTGGQATSWDVINNTYEPLNRWDGSFLSALSMPSSKYIDLTLGATGSTYTAPANGWFVCACTGTTGSTYFGMNNYKTENGVCASFNGGWGRAMLPVTKGDTVIVFYGGTNFVSKQFRSVTLSAKLNSGLN